MIEYKPCGRKFYCTEWGICLTDFDLFEMWQEDPTIQEDYPHFGWYLSACQTWKGGTLEEID